jgi:hypothetical protein
LKFRHSGLTRPRIRRRARPLTTRTGNAPSCRNGGAYLRRHLAAAAIALSAASTGAQVEEPIAGALQQAQHGLSADRRVIRLREAGDTSCNFIAEIAAAERRRTFNVGAFAGGGKIAVLGPPEDFKRSAVEASLVHWADR